MATLTGILLIATVVAAAAFAFKRTKQNATTLGVAVVLLVIAAAITGSA